ncbi:putative ribonuclease H-like domain-containing protein [Tanacetum coccineum]|uniref:Ribonuclease H-like domain-containing protein n=1 Tax=Tanacetum coccineum TaxID=301880 RepID=A0ABQ4XVF1_9ASTR
MGFYGVECFELERVIRGQGKWERVWDSCRGVLESGFAVKTGGMGWKSFIIGRDNQNGVVGLPLLGSSKLKQKVSNSGKELSRLLVSSKKKGLGPLGLAKLPAHWLDGDKLALRCTAVTNIEVSFPAKFTQDLLRVCGVVERTWRLIKSIIHIHNWTKSDRQLKPDNQSYFTVALRMKNAQGDHSTDNDIGVLRIPRIHDLHHSHLTPATRTKGYLLVRKKHPSMNPPAGTKDGHVNFKTINKLVRKGSITNPSYKSPYELISGKVIPRFKTDTPAGTYGTNINAGTQDHDSDSEVDEQVIVVPSFPSNRFAGPSSSNGPRIMERNADYAEELAKLQRQEYEAKDAAARYGYLFSQATAEILCQAEAEIRNQGVSAVQDPAGVDSAVKDSAGVDSAVRVPSGIVSADGVSTGSPSADSDPAGGNPADSFPPAGSVEPADESNPAVSSSVSADLNSVYADESTLPPGQQLGTSENTTRFPVPSDVCMDQLSSGIFTSSSYDDDFRATLTNLAPAVEVNLVPTKRVNTIHPQSQILGDLASPVLTRSRAHKSKFGESAFIGYVHDSTMKKRINHTDQLHCLSACFLSQLEPTSIAKALEDPDWVDAMQEEMQQFINQQVWKLVPLPDGKHAIGTKWILKNSADAEGIVVRNKARLVAQGHRQEEGIDYDEVFAPVARIEAIRLFLAFASYMGFLVYQLDVKSAFLYGEIEEEVYVTQHKALKDPLFPQSMYTEWLKLCMDFIKHLEPGMQDCLLFCYNTITEEVYVDDIIFGSTNKAWCDEFEFKTMYDKDMLSSSTMESVRTATTPYEAAKTKLKDETDPPVNVHLYRSMIGSLMYLTASRPDIMFAVSACSRHQVTPLTSHLNALEAYSDSDYAGSHGDRKSTTGGCQFLGRRLISLAVQEQTIELTSKMSRRTRILRLASLYTRMPMRRTDSSAVDSTDDNLADLLTKAFDGQDCVNWWSYWDGESLFRELRGVIPPAASLVSAGSSMVLLVVILPAGRMVSAGCTMVLLEVIVPAGFFVPAGSYGLCCW